MKNYKKYLADPGEDYNYVSGDCPQRFCLELFEQTTGPCRAAFPKWGFNQNSQRCEKFIYGGCKANGNMMDSKEECKRNCVSCHHRHKPNVNNRPKPNVNHRPKPTVNYRPKPNHDGTNHDGLWNQIHKAVGAVHHHVNDHVNKFLEHFN